MTDLIGWLPSLPLRIEPPSQRERLPSGDWRQDAAYPEPLWARTAAELARRVSIENLEQFYALRLLPRHDVARAAEFFAMAGWSKGRAFRVQLSEAADPLAEGFLRRVRLWRDDGAPGQPADAATVFAHFARAELARIDRPEAWLRARYGERPAGGEVFDWIDYPCFDNGTMTLGFALLVHGPELHFWSRLAHAHK